MLIYINNALVTADAGSLTINDAVGQRTTCEFVVRDDAGATTFQQGQPVKVVDDSNSNTILFQGFIDNIQQTKRSYAATLSHDIQCVDYHYLSDKRIAAKTYSSQTADFIVNDMLTSYLNAEGVIGTTAAPTFTRASVAYNAEGGSVSSGAPRYEAGAFGNAIWVEEGVTNLLTANQSSVETDTTGFTVSNGTITRVTTQFWTGTASLQVDGNGTSSDSFASPGGDVGGLRLGMTAGNTYTCSAYIYVPSTTGLTPDHAPGLCIAAFYKDSGGVYHGTNSASPTVTNQWQRLSITMSIPAGATEAFFRLYDGFLAAGHPVYFDGIQVEQRGYATSWQIGGTARNAEVINLPVPASIANPQEGTIDFRFYVNANSLIQNGGTSPRLISLSLPNDAIHGIVLYHLNSSANWSFETRSQDGTLSTSISVPDSSTSVNNWHLFTCTWSATANIVEFYVDGVLQNSTTNPHLPTALGTVTGTYLGHNSGNNYIDTLVDGFRISTRRRTASEIAAYAGSALSYDVDTSYLLNFDGSLTPQTSIQSAATVNTAIFDYITVSDCMDQLADYAGYWWNIDANSLLHFSPRAQINAPFTVDGTYMDDGSVAVQINNPMYRNRQFIKGGTDVTSTQTETRQGDGKATAFTMSYPLAQVPTITLNSVSQTVGIKGVDSGKQWYWNKDDAVISQDSAGTKLISTDTLSVTYVGQFPIVVLSYDSAGVTSRQSIEGGTTTGYVEAAESVQNVTSSAQGFQIANARISRYSNLSGITITFDTLTYGLAPGQTLTVNLPSHNVNNVQTLIEGVTTKDDQTLSVPIYSIKALVGPANTTYVQFWNTLFGRTQSASNQSSIGGTNTTLAIETPFSETWTWNANESVTETVYSCPVPASTLFPSATLFPC